MDDLLHTAFIVAVAVLATTVVGCIIFVGGILIELCIISSRNSDMDIEPRD